MVRKKSEIPTSLHALINHRKKPYVWLYVSEYEVLAYLTTAACFLALVNASFAQLQMLLFSGRVFFGTSLIKVFLLIVVAFGCLAKPRIKVGSMPVAVWLACTAFLLLEISYFTIFCGMSLANVLLSYYDYYFLLLIGPALLIYRGAVSHAVLTRCTITIFVICAIIATAQYATSSPILYTESLDKSFQVPSWEFIGEVRAFSLFGSALEFGLFSAFCGALGVALTRTMPKRGAILVVLAAFACYTTLTRLCYLLFICACTYSGVLTFNKKRSRGRWHPFLFLILGVGTIIVGLTSFTSGEANKLQDAGSIFMRIEQWSFYLDLLRHATPTALLFGFGITQNESILPRFPMIIDNTPLALVLHVGIFGLTFFGVLLFKMWAYLRHEALLGQQPFLIAVASLWSTFACAGMFNILFGVFGTVFALAVLCERKKSIFY